jgi:hypothetical protein
MMRINSLSLSPNYVGERDRVRGYLTDILLYHPSPLSSPLKGRGIKVKAYFLNKCTHAGKGLIVCPRNMAFDF